MRVPTSRRALLQTLASFPVAATLSRNVALKSLHQLYDDEPAPLRRSIEGRQLSRARYHRAEGFFQVPEHCETGEARYSFYNAGIVAQLGLSAHLLDIGFPDEWCARHIGLRVSKSLAYANATGLGYPCADTAKLAEVLTPYWKWRRPLLQGDPQPDDGGFSADAVHMLLRALLDHIRIVTGHPRPAGWRRRAPKASAS